MKVDDAGSSVPEKYIAVIIQNYRAGARLGAMVKTVTEGRRRKQGGGRKKGEEEGEKGEKRGER